MSRAISRETFDKRKNYLGVYMQQGRVILDSDWNEAQDITSSMLERISREAMGEGSPNNGFRVDRIFPIPLHELADQIEGTMAQLDPAEPEAGVEGALQNVFQSALGSCVGWLFGLVGQYFFGPLMFFIQFPGDLLDDCESLEGWELDPADGNLVVGRDVPFSGNGFLRLTGHNDTVRLVKTVPEGRLDLSPYQMLVFRFRTNEQVPGPIRFFLEDEGGGRTTWTFDNPALAAGQWLAGFAAPLDARFHIFTESSLPTAYVEQPEVGEVGDTPFGEVPYMAFVGAVGGKPPLEWEVSDGELPEGLELDLPDIDDDGDGPLEEGRMITIQGEPEETGTFDFTLKVTDADGEEAEKEFRLVVEETAPSGVPSLPIPGALDVLQFVARYEIGPDGAADPARTVRYGFELYQDATTPLVWELDDLRLGSTALQEEKGRNNFIIRGSDLSQMAAQVALMGLFRDLSDEVDDGEAGDLVPQSDVELDLLEVLNADFQITQPDLENAGRMYVDGLPCLQLHDILYSEQADPYDPPLVTPPPGSGTRKDTVYLDVWKEPVTFVEDPEIREIALGGPDTSTRLRLHHRVRVAQGGPMPSGDGRGQGLLATEGVYKGRDNRLYRVEIEEPGDLGTATFRWSDENGSVLGRIIRTVPAGTRVVEVEEAARFHAQDRVLVRSGLRQEKARIASVVDDTITLEDPVSETYAMEDRPRIERWNAFDVAISPDPGDPLVSTSVELNDGVRVRFGGREMLRGDFWTFQTRYLARDQSAGVDPETRIEDLGFVRPEGVRHHYAPLARITRREGDEGRIREIKDLRRRTGNTTVTDVGLSPLTVAGVPPEDAVPEHLGGTLLPPASKDSKILTFLSGSLYVSEEGAEPDDAELTILVALYNDERSDPAEEPDEGRIQDETRRLPLGRVEPEVEIPVHITAVSSGTPFAFLPTDAFTPTSVEVFAQVTGEGFSVELSNLRLTAVELKKST